jgi:hypothetical protein
MSPDAIFEFLFDNLRKELHEDTNAVEVVYPGDHPTNSTITWACNCTFKCNNCGYISKRTQRLTQDQFFFIDEGNGGPLSAYVNNTTTNGDYMPRHPRPCEKRNCQGDYFRVHENLSLPLILCLCTPSGPDVSFSSDYKSRLQ